MSGAALVPEPSDDSSIAKSVAERKFCHNTASNAVSLKDLVDFMNKDADLWIFQHFNRLNLFNIVYLQQHLAGLERRLDKAVPDKLADFNKQEYEILMPEIESSLKKYGMSRDLAWQTEKPDLCQSKR